MSVWAQSMLLWSWQALVVVGLILLATKFGGSGSATARHRLWLIGILVIAVLPFANSTIRIPRVLPRALEPLQSRTPVPAVTRNSTTEEARPVRDAGPKPSPEFPSVGSLPTAALFAFWVLGVGYSLFISGRSYCRARRLCKGAQIVENPSSRVPIAYSTQLQTPLLAGLRRPMVLLPIDIANWTTEEEQRAIVLHELAHFERRDHLVNLIQAFLGAVLFFHPAVRYALRQLVLERELACDEFVLKAGTRPAAYVEVIMKVAERSIARDHYSLAFGSPGEILERRIQMILHYRSITVSRRLGFVRIAAVLLPVLLLLPQRAVPLEIRSAVGSHSATPVASGSTQDPQLTPAPIPVQSVAARSPRQAKAKATVGPAQVALARPLAISPPTAPQAGSLTGTISDQTGAVIPGATVTVSPLGEVSGLAPVTPNAENGTALSVVSDSRGVFAFAGLSPGTYVLEVNLPGFARHRRTFVMGPGSAITRDVILPLAGSTVSVEVSVEAPSTAVVPSSENTLPVRVGGVVSAPSLIYAPKPAYPPRARAKQIQDYVVLQAVISAEGLIASLRPDTSQGSGDVELLRAALDAVRQWRFRPASLNGQPIEWTTTVTVNFTLVK